VGEEFQVALHLSTSQAITRLRSQVRFDPGAVQLLTATAGDLIPSSANTPAVNTHPGGAQLEVVTTSDSPVQGNGSIMVLRFKALQARPATSIAGMVAVVGSAGAAVGNSPAQPLSVAIQP
jgi:hypothetical protein